MASPGPSGNKLSEMLRAGNQQTTAQQYHDEMQSQQQRMAVMAAAVSAGMPRMSTIVNYNNTRVVKNIPAKSTFKYTCHSLSKPRERKQLRTNERLLLSCAG